MTGAEPTDTEKEVYTKVAEALSNGPGIIEELRAYRGAGETIREVRWMD